jgi:hypothetical protein
VGDGLVVGDAGDTDGPDVDGVGRMLAGTRVWDGRGEYVGLGTDAGFGAGRGEPVAAVSGRTYT